MCEELGGEGDMLQDYIEAAGNTSLCSVETRSGCSDREVAYIDKMAAIPADDVQAQFDRILTMEGESMKPELKDWMLTRKKILQKLLVPVAVDEPEL